jgi:sugar lactone lactonase YvrE
MKPIVIFLLVAGCLSGPGTAQVPPTVEFVDVPLRAGDTATTLRWASGVAVDRAGNRYVVEWARHAILKISPAGDVTTFAGRADVSGADDGKADEARFNATLSSLAVAADEGGTVFVADSVNQTIRKVTTDGDVTTIAGMPGALGNVDGAGREARFAFPSGIAVDGAGTLYVADTNNCAIRKISPDGVVSTLAGKPGVFGTVDGVGEHARFFFPAAIAVDRDRTVYVASFDNTLRKVSPQGEVSTLAGGPLRLGFSDEPWAFYFSLNFPTDYVAVGLTVDRNGQVWAVDPGRKVVHRITPAGAVTTFGRAARLYWPTGIATDATGALHVVDSGAEGRLLKADLLEGP